MCCGVCHRQVAWTESGLPEIEKRLAQESGFSEAKPGWSAEQQNWACQLCLDAGKAIEGDPTVQNGAGAGSTVYFAYWDRDRRCEHCGKSFVFTAGEQMFGYERIQLHVCSVPPGCRECRGELLRRKKAERKLVERLRAIDRPDWKQVAELSPLYLELGEKALALEALRLARRLCPEGERKALDERIRQLENKPVRPKPDHQFSRVARLKEWPDCPPRWAKERERRARSFLSPEGLEVMNDILAEWRQNRAATQNG